MSSYVAPIDRYNNNVQYYTYQTNPPATKIKAYSGWSSWKNNKSGNFGRVYCGHCLNAKSFPQSAGVYPLNIDDRGMEKIPIEPVYPAIDPSMVHLDSGEIGGYYVDYLNDQCGVTYPKQYVRGFWPDEQQVVTNTPKGACSSTPNPVNEMSINLSRYY